MGSSQLKKLRASLKESGLIGQHSQKSKRQSNGYKNKKEQERTVERIREAFNPFATKVNRQKQDVIGRKQEVGRPGLRKQTEEDSRRQAYQADLLQHNRVGGILDRRFGENNPSLSYDEKMQERFTREYQSKASKGSLFNLEDDDEGGAYGGLSLSLRDDFDEGDLGIAPGENEDDDAEGKAAYLQRKAMRDGNEDDNSLGEPTEESLGEAKKKNKAEVMKEVIAKSKMHKFERQQSKLEDLGIMDELDDEDNIRELMDDLTGLERETAKKSKAEPKKPKDDDDYEKVIREMAFDRRAKPTDRSLTEKEQEDKEREERGKLNRERLERMTGEVEGQDVENIDFDDDFVGSEDENEAAGFGFRVENDEEDEEDSEDDNDDDDDDDKEIEGHVNGRPVVAKNLDVDCPTTFDDIKSSFSKQTLSEQLASIKQILKTYAPSRAKGNKELIGKFTIALIDYVCWLAQEKTNVIAENQVSFNKLVSQLKKLIEEYVVDCSVHFRKILQQISLDKPVKEYGGSELFVFTLIGIAYSTSDHYHLVSTAAELLITNASLRNDLANEKELFAGLFLAQNYLAYQRHSKRYSPEIINFLLQALVSLVGSDSSDEYEFPAGCYIKPEVVGKLALPKRAYKQVFSDDSAKFSGFVSDDQATGERSSLLVLTLKTILKASDTWKEKSAYSEIFMPFIGILENTKAIAANAYISECHKKLSKLVGFNIKEKVPLTLQAHRPMALKTSAPKFEENYSLDRKSYNDAPEIAERRKLQAEFKNEKKAVLRDIRKDAKFMAREKLKRKIAQDSAYHDKLAKLERSIQTEEGAEKNKYEREKKRRK